MNYGKPLTLAERWQIDSDMMEGDYPPPPKNKATGAELYSNILYFGEDFLHLSKEDMVRLSAPKFTAVCALEDLFCELKLNLYDKLGTGDAAFKKLESLCDEGLGETLDEMYANSPEGTLVPKYVREYLLSRGVDKEDILGYFAAGYGDEFPKDLFMEASYAKLGIDD